MDNPRQEEEDNYESSDDEHTPTRADFPTSNSLFLFPPRPSNSTTPSRSNSPLPQFYPTTNSSDSDTEPSSPLLDHREWRPPRDRPRWWSSRSSSSSRRRRRTWRITRFCKLWLRRIVNHPFFPAQPITIVLTLILFSVFAISLTLLLIYVLNPDKDPLPWRAYCTVPHLAPPFDRPMPPNSPSIYPNYTDPNITPSFPPDNLDSLPPAGVFVGVFSIDSAFERRMLVRTTWASHPRSRDGAGRGDDGIGTSRTIVRFVVGQPRKDWERRIKLEMEMYNDIIILPIPENMNGGKSYTFFSWAAINAWVPPVYKDSTVPPPTFSYSNATSSPPSLATHDPFIAWSDINSGRSKAWVRPDFIVKVDDDSFIMLAELEARLRAELHATKSSTSPGTTSDSSSSTTTTTTTTSQNSSFSQPKSSLPMVAPSSRDPMIYWGFLVTNRLHTFMAGELYALSWNLVEWLSRDPTVKTMTRGAEDKQTAKWMRIHPKASEIRWTSERCWIYDHPRSGTVYSHGYLFPSEVTRVKRAMKEEIEKMSSMIPGAVPTSAVGHAGTPASWAHSSVSTFGVRYTPPLPDLSTVHSIEALVEGSDMSMLREGSPMTPEYAWTHREGRKARYESKRVGGTVVVHFIKKNMWYLETALALLEDEEQSESEKYESDRGDSWLRTPLRTLISRPREPSLPTSDPPQESQSTPDTP